MSNQHISREPKPVTESKKIDTKEFELPETAFISDIDSQIFQDIVLQCLSKIDGIVLAQGGFLNNILGRAGPEVGCAVQSEKDHRSHSVSIKIEVNIEYGLSIPKKAEEIQTKVAEEITRLTGLHVSAIHLVFRNIISPDQMQKMMSGINQHKISGESDYEPEYSDNF